jgi:hypothetical protein
VVIVIVGEAKLSSLVLEIGVSRETIGVSDKPRHRYWDYYSRAEIFAGAARRRAGYVRLKMLRFATRMTRIYSQRWKRQRFLHGLASS